MRQRVAVLHTSLVFLTVDPVLTDLLEETLPEADVVHFVDSDVLATVMREGRISDASTSRMVHLAQAAEAAGADVIFSACSSLGPAIDTARRSVATPIVKIDDAMTGRAVAAERIGVLATVPTTLGPTSELIELKAAAAARPVRIVPRLCKGAFAALLGGDTTRHDAMVTAGARELAAEVDLIVLAQASMARLAPPLAEATGRPVLSSPRLGVESLKAALARPAPALA